VFWVVVALILAIAVATLALLRARRSALGAGSSPRFECGKPALNLKATSAARSRFKLKVCAAYALPNVEAQMRSSARPHGPQRRVNSPVPAKNRGIERITRPILNG